MIDHHEEHHHEQIAAISAELTSIHNAVMALKLAAHDPARRGFLHQFRRELGEASTILQSALGNVDRWAKDGEKPKPDHLEAGHLARALR